MDDYADYAGNAGRLLAGRYRLSRTVADSQDLVEAIAYDSASQQEVLVRQVQLPETVEAEVVGGGGYAEASGAGHADFAGAAGRGGAGGAGSDPAVRRALEAAVAAARLPDHPRLDQVFDVFLDGEGLWVVSELLPATPLAALLAEQSLGAHRAAEIGADLLAALRAVHAQGWTHRNVTARTVLVCDDGRALLTGLSVGAAQEALCGYDPLPAPGGVREPPGGDIPDSGTGTGTPTPEGPAARATGFPGNGVAQGSAEAGAGNGRPPAPPPAPRSGGGAPTPVPWAGLPLPEGFAARDGAEGDADDGADDGVRDGGVRDDGERGVDEREFGAFGFRGVPSQQGEPGRPGQARAVPGGAVAAYRAGTQRAAAQRAWENAGRPQDEAPRQDAGAGGDWWSRPTQQPQPQPQPQLHSRQSAGQDRAQDPAQEPGPGPGPGAVPDDCVRWLPPSGDEVSPTSLPGARRTNSHAVKALWSPAAVPPASQPGPEAGPEPDGSGEYATGTGIDADTGTDADADADVDAESSEVTTRPWGPDYPGAGYRGPSTALAAERARQARMTVVGAVTERWAPEQAGPVYENWRLAPPVGPAADLWALGALLFRAVQGHAPYPEESVAELVGMVCGEPPAFAEDCGPLRPVVESLMRQDPTDRPDFEVLNGWLRSLVRSAPEPDAGLHTVTSPLALEPGGPADPRRLPILRRRGELVRRRWTGRRAERRAAHLDRAERAERAERAGGAERAERRRHKRENRGRREKQGGRDEAGRPRGPRSLGRWVLGLVLLGLAAAVLYAMLLMPGGRPNGAGDERQSSVDQQDRAVPRDPRPSGSGTADDASSGGKGAHGSTAPARHPSSKPPESSKKPRDSAPAGHAPKGYKLSKDPEGFRIAVPSGWNRRSTPGHGQVVYSGGELEMLVVSARDTAKKYGKDPMAYQNGHEPELAPYRAADWASTTGLRRIDVGAATMAEGTFSWRDGGRQVYARNRAMLLHGRYHLVLVMGSESRKKEIDRTFETVADTYRVTGS